MAGQSLDAQYRELRDEIRNMALSRLNDGQKQAARTGEGPVLCLAGAGSGKTTAMVYRIWHLLTYGPTYDPDVGAPVWINDEAIDYLAEFLADQGRRDGGPALSRRVLELIGQRGVPMYNILAITFTNKAAREMRERLEALLGDSLSDMWVMTFHSACLRILRRESDYLEGYTDEFTIYDAADQEQVVKVILRGLNVEEKEHPPRAYINWISGQKSNMKLPPKDYSPPSKHMEHLFPYVYARYQDLLEKSNAMDFDDLLLQTVLLFQRHPDRLRRYQDRFRYIMVDEYQDTNHIQYRFVSMLAREHRNICVVGDDDQSIYSFRQADIRNILDFEKDFPGAVVIRLEQNYRSTKRILEAANFVIANNRQRKEKTLWTQKEQGEKLQLYRAADDRDEARYVCSQVQLSREEGGIYSENAVLMRTNAQSRVIEEWFAAFHIPYVMIGGIRFYERMEIKDILAYLKLIVNPNDQVAFRRIVNVPRRGIGDATVNRVVARSAQSGLSLAQALYDREGLDLPSRADKSLEAFRGLLTKLRGLASERNVGQLTQCVLEESGYRRALLDKESPENMERWENILQFLTRADEFDMSVGGSLAEFLGEISLYTDLDLAEDEKYAGAVQVMTMHMAKGLEFPRVFMVGMEEKIFPHYRSISDNEIEEERRLCYVAMTRAKSRLYLTWAMRRGQFGSYTNQQPSRFLDEVPRHLIDGWQESSGRFGFGGAGGEYYDFSDPDYSDSRAMRGSRGGTGAHGAYDYDEARGVYGARGASDSSSAGGGKSGRGVPTSPGEAFRPGDKINHRLWGLGVVVSVRGSGSSMVYTIAFPEKGIRDLQADIAPISRAE